MTGRNFLTKDEKNTNNGIDIIFPYINKITEDFELWVLQVKTGKNRCKSITKKVALLEKRSNELLDWIQNSDKSEKDIIKKFKIDKSLVKTLKDYKDKFKTTKTMWVSEVKEEHPQVSTTTFETIETLLVKKSIYKNSYHLQSLMENKKFSVTTDFSGSNDKAITIEEEVNEQKNYNYFNYPNRNKWITKCNGKNK